MEYLKNLKGKLSVMTKSANSASGRPRAVQKGISVSCFFRTQQELVLYKQVEEMAQWVRADIMDHAH